MARSIVAAAALALLTFCVYLPVREHAFVEFDDPLYVTANTRVQQGLTADNVIWALTSGDAFIWHPLTWLSYLLDSELHGTTRAGPWLLTNAALHALNAALVMALLLSLARLAPGGPAGQERPAGADAAEIGTAAFGAALFALHPIQVESVAWVSARKELLAAFFLLLAVQAYLGWARRGGHLRYAAIVVSASLSLCAKGSHVALPLLLLALDAWPLGRIPLSGRAATWRCAWPLVREKAPLFGLSLASVAINGLLVGSAFSFWPADPPLASRAGSAVVALVDYLDRLVWPSGLAIVYPNPLQLGVPSWSAARIAGSLALLVLISLLVSRERRRRGYLLLAWLWLVGMLLPMLGLLPMGLRSPHDRYAYVPMIGFVLVLAFALRELAARGRVARASGVVLACSALLACAVAAGRQIAVWRDSSSLFDHALAVTEGNAVVHYSKGTQLARLGASDEAIEQLEAALEHQPLFADAHHNLGYLLVQRGETARAIAHLERAIELRPDWPRALSNLGYAQLRSGDPVAAAGSFERALALAPERVAAHHALGTALLAAGRPDDAAAAFREALRRDPGHAPSRAALALLEGEAQGGRW